MKYLEENIKTVHGNWGDEGFLKVNNGQWFIRLAKLEERWREGEEREAETQNKPKT